MSKNNPLLQTLIESPNPEPISMWPQTLGWKVVAITALCLLGYSMLKAYQNWMKNKYKRQAVRQLNELARSDEDNDTRAKKLNKIIKIVAAQSYGHEQVAALHGTSWGSFLITSSEAKIDSNQVMRWQSSLYQPKSGVSDEDLDLLIMWAIEWVSNHKAEEPKGNTFIGEVQHD